jgi:peptide/nickel transport system permease protein
MLRYIVRRLLWAVVLFIAVTMITYIIFFVIPADPAVLAAGRSARPADVARVRHVLGLDHSIPYQYGKFLGKLIGVHWSRQHGDVWNIDFTTPSLGISFVNRRQVNTMVGQAAPVTASLVFGGAVLWMLLAIPIGVLSALRPRSLLDRGAMVFVLIGISMPVIVIGLVLQYLFGFRWPILPNAGYCNVINPPTGSTCGGVVDWFVHMILPWITFAILFTAIYVRMIRSNVMDTLGEDYVRTARAKGAPEPRVMTKHVLRNAMLPVVTMLGMDIAVALGGAIFTETIFGLPGLGRLAVQSLMAFDLPTIEGVVVFATLCIIVLNLFVDVLYAFIDPRIRLE